MLRDVLARGKADRARVLDVGAGPASTVGFRFDDRPLDLVAVDPLAETYDTLLSDAGVEPPVHTQRVDGERLLERFGADRFDVAYSRNALDHAVDPVRIVEEMVAVVRPGGHVVLRHVRNEAMHQEYVQLHQWNFDERAGDFIVWGRQAETNVTARLERVAEVSCWRDVEPGDDEGGWVVSVLQKRPA